jgi:hypothetical protein
MHGPRVLSAVIPLSGLFHYVGFALAIGSAMALTILRRRARLEAGPARAGLDRAIAEVSAKGEVPGWFIALFGGLLSVIANPSAIDPQGSLGPWLFVKTPLVIALIAIACVKMLDARLLVRERESGAKDEELAPLVARDGKLDLATIVLSFAVLFIASFRFVLFA